MSSSSKRKNFFKKNLLLTPGKIKIGIAVSEWHPEVTEELYAGAEKFLLENGIAKKNILRKNSPGSFELPLTAQFLLKKKCDAVICLGCVIKGETDHYHYICKTVSQGIMNVSLAANKPVSFGVLTTDTLEQALNRAGGKFGNKGEEAAEAVLKMLS
ncbi:MAG: 6,7-dimethyl-8-ribityllumazine synthase [Bacteroidetes bacterium]|nr:6,7-dimethyl-8-ribityllumazine synthase [Bacteroidota bacterium]